MTGTGTGAQAQAQAQVGDAAGAAGGDAYAEIVYWSVPHHDADPNRIAAVARLHGLTAPDPTSARVLELGGGDGGNAMAIGSAWPRSHSLCVDLSEAAIERGRGLVTTAGLDNVELLAADLLEFEPEQGAYDYVVVHGVYSWVPDVVRTATFAIAARALAPDGVLVVDHNARPGWDLWHPSRSLLRLGAATGSTAAEEIERGRACISLAAELGADDSLYGQVLELSRVRAAERTDSHLYHDDMGPVTAPFAVHQVAGAAAAHGLGYVGQLRATDWWETDARVAATIEARFGHDPVLAQRFADLVRGPQFQAAVFARQDVVDRSRTPMRAAAACRCVITPELVASGDADPDWGAMERSLVDAAVQAGPRGVVVGDVAAQLAASAVPSGCEVEDVVGAAALELASAQVVALRATHPPAAARAGARPVAHALARAQTHHTQVVTRLVHDYVVIDDPLSTTVLQLLDGGHDHDSLCAEIAGRLWGDGASGDAIRPQVEQVLERFAREGLLRADD